MKTINFAGQFWKAPAWANYITQDSTTSGAIIAWEHCPKLFGAEYRSNPANWTNPGESKCLGHVPFVANIQSI